MVQSIQEMTQTTKTNDDTCFQICLSTIDVETSKWRAEVTSELKALRKRIWALERHNVTQTESLRQITSFAEGETDKCCGLYTSVHLLKTNWVSRLQCILLLVAIIVFSSCTVSYYFKARSNELAIWKPLKINQTIEYGNTNMQYEMPYVYVAFKITYTDSSSDSIINETLSGIKETQLQHSWICATDYFSSERRSPVGCEWFVARFEARPRENWGYFRFKLDNPTPGNGSFQYSVVLKASNMIFDDSFEMTGFWVSITRDEKPDFSKFVYLNAEEPLSGGTSLQYVVDYTETAVDDAHYFTNSIAWSSELPSNGILRIVAKPNLRVEYWTEYVVFGYADWIFGMGGLYNFFAIGFFYTAYYVAACFNDNWSMGILPEFSFIFSNLEMILWLKHITLPVFEGEDTESEDTESDASYKALVV